jgi:Polysaccharide lyase/Malectin domain
MPYKKPIVKALVTTIAAVLSIAPQAVPFTAAAVSSTIAINGGGGAVTTGDGFRYSSDTGFVGGRVATSSKVLGGSDPMVYKDLRVGIKSYTLPIANGDYDVTLMLIENVWTTPGKRTFNVAIEGSTKLSAFDIFAAANGRHHAYDRTFKTTVADGTINIDFTAVRDLPSIAGIKVIPHVDTLLASAPTRETPVPNAQTVPSSSAILFRSDYSVPSDNASKTGWSAEQEPRFPGPSGAVANDRITIVGGADVPGAGVYKPDNGAMRVELRPYGSSPLAADGDVQVGSDGYKASRAEVYGRVPASMSGTAVAQWPDPVDSVRWYGFSVYVPLDFESAPDTRWLTLTQWKGLKGGSPPVGLEVKRGNLRLGGTRTNQGLVPNDGNLGALRKGQWTRIVVGLKFSPDSSRGWVEVHRDGVQVLPRTPLATMDRDNGAAGDPDPIYLKQGIYRDSAWQTTHVLYFGPATVGTTREAVMG